jgi:hypothetical protein
MSCPSGGPGRETFEPSLTFRLENPTNQGHLQRAGWPDHSVVFQGLAVSIP